MARFYARSEILFLLPHGSHRHNESCSHINPESVCSVALDTYGFVAGHPSISSFQGFDQSETAVDLAHTRNQ